MTPGDDDTTPPADPCADIPDGGPVTPANATGYIAGSVWDKMTATPIVDALVMAGGMTAVTDGGGNYFMNVGAPGTVEVTAVADGYTVATKVWDANEVNFDMRTDNFFDSSLPGDVTITLAGADADSSLGASANTGVDYFDRFRAEILTPEDPSATLEDLPAGWGWAYGVESDSDGDLVRAGMWGPVDPSAHPAGTITLNSANRWWVEGSVPDPLGDGEPIALSMKFFDCSLGFDSETGYTYYATPGSDFGAWLPMAPAGSYTMLNATTAGEELTRVMVVSDPDAWMDVSFDMPEPVITYPMDMEEGVGSTPTITWEAPPDSAQVGSVVIGIKDTVGAIKEWVWTAIIDGDAGWTSITVPDEVGLEIGSRYRLSVRWSDTHWDSPNYGDPGEVYLPDDGMSEGGATILFEP